MTHTKKTFLATLLLTLAACEQDNYKQAIDAYDRGDYDEATANYEEAIIMLPTGILKCGVEINIEKARKAKRGKTK